MGYNQKLKLLIDGKWTDSSQRDTLPVIDPATEKILSHLPIADENDMERALVSSKKGFQIWSKWTPLRRQAVMLKTVEIIRKRSDEIAKTLTIYSVLYDKWHQTRKEKNSGLAQFRAAQLG